MAWLCLGLYRRAANQQPISGKSDLAAGSLDKKIQELGFTVRSRLEERYLETSENTAYRYRQYFKIVVPLVQTAKLNLASTEEIFWHLNNFNGLNNHGFDQNRFFLGLNYKMTSTLTTEIGHLNQYIRRVNNSNFQSNVLAMNFLLNL